MKIVMWIGSHANQKALANKIHARFSLSGIVIEKPAGRRKITIRKIYEKIIDKLFLPGITRAWFNMLNGYDRTYKTYPAVETLEEENINSDAVMGFTKELAPDIIVVSGTRMIRQKTLSLDPSIGIINLHTGLSPYLKGGPNCTNWCIATNQLQLIGNTIMWIDKGIDTGNIITTEQTSFDGSESLEEVHVQVIEHAHGLYLRAIEKLIEGARPSVKQSSIAEGTTYYTKQWTLKPRFALKKNFERFRETIESEEYKKATREVKTIKL